MRDLDIRDIQADEIWGCIQRKQARITPEDDPTHGDAYAFLALARVQKLVIAHRAAKRDDAAADTFITDLRSRLLVAPHFATDGSEPYPTSRVQRLNLDVRMSTRHLTRLCNGFSRKLTHHTAAISLFVARRNFCKIHGASCAS